MPYTASSAAARCTAVPLDILLIEDNDSDILLTEIVLDATKIDYALHIVKSGADVLPYLRRRGRFGKAQHPDIMLLDLSLPEKDGFEVLAELASHAQKFAGIPIVILTGDSHCAFLKRSYDLNIAAYVTKPCSTEKIRAALEQAANNTI